jgi:hypothetical protein
MRHTGQLVNLHVSLRTGCLKAHKAACGTCRYGAPPGKKVVFFIDDVNMPAREKYGAQPPIELLRQFQDYRGMYDRKQLFWRDIEDVTLCAACGPPGGGRQEVSPRCARRHTDGVLVVHSHVLSVGTDYFWRTAQISTSA